MTLKEKFEDWFTSNASEFTFICEQFFTDVELENVELRRKLLKGWVYLAFTEGYNAFAEEAISKVLYGDIDETPYEEIKDHCKLNEQGEIDWYAINDLDTEQQVRLAIAATLRAMKE
jgi:hypothetical protein